MIDYEQIENTIDYEFNNRDLLQQAFVRRSYSEEHGGENNEVLEFIGDKALDFVIVRILIDLYGQITEREKYSELRIHFNQKFKRFLGAHDEGQLTDLKKKLVQKKMLSKCIEGLGFNKQLIMGKGDIANNIQDEDSVKEDLFEAIVGAVAVDCDYDMDIITGVIKTLIDFGSFFSGKYDDLDNYVGLLQEWSQEMGYGLPNYTYWQEDDESGFSCVVTIEDTETRNGFSFTATGIGSSQAKARMNAAREAYTELYQEGIIQNEFEVAVGEPIREESTRQLNELFQKRLIDKPNYSFYENHDEDGSTFWICELRVKGYNSVYTHQAYVKKEAQRESAYEFLCDLMDYEYEEE